MCYSGSNKFKLFHFFFFFKKYFLDLDNIFHAPGVEKEHTLVVKGASSEAQLALLPESKKEKKRHL